MRYILFIGMVGILSSCNGPKNKETSTTAAAKAQNFVDESVTPYLDTIPADQTVMSLLDKFPLAIDSANDVVITVPRISLPVSAYKNVRNATGKEHGVVNADINLYRRLLPLSDDEKKLLDLFEGFAREATYLANRNNFIYPANGELNPAQNGLAYSWGAKKFDQRLNPPGEGDSCLHNVFGLDCSGFIYQLFERNGIRFLKGRADDQRNPAVLKKALIPYFGDSTRFDVVDMNIPPSQFQSGDIVYFQKNGRAYHIGMCLKLGTGELRFYESSGGPNKCEENLSVVRGPRGLKITQRLAGSGYGVARIVLKPPTY
jgi:hypothetical protein